MSSEKWFRIFERELAEAEDRGMKHPDEWAAERATEKLKEQMADRADYLLDRERDERSLGER